MSGTTRITVASLASTVAEQGRAIAEIASAVTGIASALQAGQFATPAPVAQITDAPSKRARKSTSKGKTTKVAPKVSKSAPAKKAMPAELREGFALVRETKDAMQPLNKALAQVRKGQPWVKAHLAPEADVKAALALLAPAERKAATKALKVRAEAAAKRA